MLWAKIIENKNNDKWNNLFISTSIHPENDNIIYVAALGHTYGPQKERGIYRTVNGGKSWEQILFIDENTGGIDIALFLLVYLYHLVNHFCPVFPMSHHHP